MTLRYSADRYGVIERKWFGLTQKTGGDAAAGFTFGTHTATSGKHVTRWYPKGPIEMVKAGYLVLATLANASGGVRPIRFYTRGASASLACTLKGASCTQAQYSIASQPTFTVAQVKAGEYVAIKYGTAVTLSATASAVRATTTGTVAYFIDWKRKFSDTDEKWG